VIAPLIVPPESGYRIDRNTFFVYGSFRDQARVLVDYLADDLRAGTGKGRVAVVAFADKASRGASEGAAEQAARRAVPVVATETYGPGAFDPAASVGRLRGKGVDAVLFFGPGEDAAAFLSSAARAGWRPRFLTSAAMAGQTMASLGRELSGKVALASPVAPPDRGSREFADFEDAAARTPGSGRHRPFQATAFAGAKLFEAGLARTGRAATRGAFVSELGKLFGFRTGVTPPLTFHENRRVGAVGAMVLRVDPSGRGFLPVGGWREPK
jgi:ABC-type branched-subunit amino acid transport system substrate-binding protein